LQIFEENNGNYKEYKHWGFTIQHDVKRALEPYFQECYEEPQILVDKAGKEDIFVHPDVLCKKDGSEYIIEVKSGRFSNYHFDQVALYKYVLGRDGHPIYAALVYTESKEVYTDSLELARIFKRMGFTVHYNAHYFIHGWQLYVLIKLNSERDAYNKGPWCFSCANPACPIKRRMAHYMKELDVPQDARQTTLEDFSKAQGE